MAQWITRLTSDQKIPDSSPGKVALLLGLYCLKKLIFDQIFIEIYGPCGAMDVSENSRFESWQGRLAFISGLKSLKTLFQ